MITSKAIFFMNFLPQKKYGLPSHNFVKKNVVCEKVDEITRFDGSHEKILMMKTMVSSMMMIMLEFIIYRCSYLNADHSSSHDEDTASKLGYNHDSIHDEEFK
jgi:hypothetical protein